MRQYKQAMRSAGDMERRAKAVLEAWLPGRVTVEHLDGNAAGDLVVRDGRMTLVVEVKRLADPGWLRGSFEQVRETARRVGRNVVPVVAVPFMGEGGRRLCQEAEMSWFDLCGNADISAPGLRIYVEGKANIFKRPGRP